MVYADFKKQLEDSFNVFFGLVEGKIKNSPHIKPSEYMDFLQKALPVIMQASMQSQKDFLDILLKEKDIELKDKQIELTKEQIKSFKSKKVSDLLKIQIDGWSRYASAVGITEDNLLSVLNGKNVEEVYREYSCVSGIEKMYTVDDYGNVQEETIDKSICEDS